MGAKLKQYNIWGVFTFKQANILITFILFLKNKTKWRSHNLQTGKKKVWKREYEERKGGAGDRFITRQLFMHARGIFDVEGGSFSFHETKYLIHDHSPSLSEADTFYNYILTRKHRWEQNCFVRMQWKRELYKLYVDILINNLSWWVK